MPIAVSVVVPVFGGEEYLGACLRTLLDQTFADFEVIVVDDGSPVDLRAIIDGVDDPEAKIRLVRHSTNRGSLHARLTGGDVAMGEYLGFVDADDEVEPWFLDRMYDAAVVHSVDMVQCALSMRDPEEQILNRGGAAHQVQGSEVLHEMLAGKMNNCLWNKLIRTSIWRSATDWMNTLPERHSFADDLLCTFHVAMACASYAHIPDAGYRYLPRTSSITAATGAEGLIRNLLSFDLYYRVVYEALAHRNEPAELVEGFCAREFINEGDHLIRKIAAASSAQASGLPRLPADFGLAGAIASTAAVRVFRST